MPRQRASGTVNPYRNFNFLVETGVSSSGFSEVLIGDGSAEVVEYREGNEAATTARKFPGQIKFGNVILKRGLSQAQDLYDWWLRTEEGEAERRTVSIDLLDESRQAVKRWILRNAWPVRYKGPILNAQGNEIVIEELELAHEGVRQETV